MQAIQHSDMTEEMPNDSAVLHKNGMVIVNDGSKQNPYSETSPIPEGLRSSSLLAKAEEIEV